jgi:hypothetical protein
MIDVHLVSIHLCDGEKKWILSQFPLVTEVIFLIGIFTLKSPFRLLRIRTTRNEKGVEVSSLTVASVMTGWTLAVINRLFTPKRTTDRRDL